MLSFSAAASFQPEQASAFEIFGLRLWGAEEDDPDIVDPLRYSVTLELAGDDAPLRRKLEGASLMIADKDRPVSGSLGLLAKARTERELLVAALYEEARYDGVVDIAIAGRSLDELPPDAEFPHDGPVPVVIRVDPGAVFTLGEIALKGDAANLSPATFGLVPGGDASSDAILKAEADIVRALKEGGRPLAKVVSREIVADHSTTTLDVTLELAAGPVAGYGETTVEGTQAMDRDFTAYMAGLERGKTYSPKEMDDARDRLLSLEVFNSVGITEAGELDANGQIPIAVSVSERKQRYLGIGATYSNTEGAGIEGYWGHRNLFGRAEKLRIDGSISRIGDAEEFGKLNYNAGIMFEKPGVLGPASKFFATVRGLSEHPDAYDRFSLKGSAGVAYELSDTQSVSAEVSLDWSKIDDAFGSNRYLIASIPLQYIFDNRDNRLDPKEGFRFLAFVEPSYDILNGTTFVKFKGEGSAYKAIDQAGKFVVAGRLAAGSILGASVEEVPADRRFYAGGGGSVRGYAYQGVGPKSVNPEGELVPTGGLSYAEASLEMRIAIRENLGIVPFIDVGTVSEEEFPDFSDVKAGAGIGLRYLTPFGPLRIDAAIPLNPDPDDPDFGIYAGIGQAF